MDYCTRPSPACFGVHYFRIISGTFVLPLKRREQKDSRLHFTVVRSLVVVTCHVLLEYNITSLTYFVAEVPCNDNDDDDESTSNYRETKSILEFEPDRLGHALLLPPSLQRLLKEKRIPVESCPTSNVMTLELAKKSSGSLLDGLRQHPQLQMWLDTKHPISIGTDDPGVFDTTATKELLLLQNTFSVSKETLRRILVESMDHAFCDNETRAPIQSQMRERLM